MDDNLRNLIKITNQIVETQSDSITIKTTLNKENILIVKNFHDENFIESIQNVQSTIINIEHLDKYDTETVSIELVTAELRKAGFYIELNDLIICNRYEVPSIFYVSKIEYHSNSGTHRNEIEQYKVITNFLQKLISKAKFTAEEDIKTLFFVVENSFLELPIDLIVYENFLDDNSLALINDFIENIESYKEKRTIFLKELIDFLTAVKAKDRFEYLLGNFKDFHERCNTSYEYYLSNFSFNKVKLELDNSVLEHSKNIRAIINDSQTKLIAIPAAFVLTASQIDLKEVLGFKNIILVISSFMFSYIIFIFIKNQRNALDIIHDNVNNYENNFKRSKATTFETEKELKTLTGLIDKSYSKTHHELRRQNTSLNIIQWCNWGISIALLLALIILKILPNEKLWQNVEYFLIKIKFFF